MVLPLGLTLPSGHGLKIILRADPKRTILKTHEKGEWGGLAGPQVGRSCTGWGHQSQPSQSMLELRDHKSSHVFPHSIYPLTYRRRAPLSPGSKEFPQIKSFLLPLEQYILKN